MFRKAKCYFDVSFPCMLNMINVVRLCPWREGEWARGFRRCTIRVENTRMVYEYLSFKRKLCFLDNSKQHQLSISITLGSKFELSIGNLKIFIIITPDYREVFEVKNVCLCEN